MIQYISDVFYFGVFELLQNPDFVDTFKSNGEDLTFVTMSSQVALYFDHCNDCLQAFGPYWDAEDHMDSGECTWFINITHATQFVFLWIEIWVRNQQVPRAQF